MRDGGGAAPGDGSASADAGPAVDASSPSADGGASVTSTIGFASSAYTLYASIGGGPAQLVQLDTGSLGAYVPRSALGPSAEVSATDTCSITYVSSGNTLSGHKATATFALLGASAKGDLSPPPVTVAMPICAVDDATWNGGMMGVGFGRSTPGDPTRNVLLQMADVVAGRMHAGYILSTHPTPHLTIGVPADVSAFKAVALTADPSGSGDWVAKSLRGCLTIPSNSGFAKECGPLLVDTGVSDTILWGPSDPTLAGTVPSGQTTVPSGTKMQIAAEAGDATMAFAFTVGSGADSPSAVSIRSASAFSINTGRALIVDYDYLFDAKNGVVGFKRAP